MKSPKFTARSTAPLLRLLHGALVTFGPLADLAFAVLREMSMNIMCNKILTSLECRLQRNFMRKLAWESPCTGISSSTKFSLNSLQPFRYLRIQRVAPFYRGSLFICFGIFVGLDFIRLPSSITNRIGHLRKSATLNSISSFSSLHFIHCKWRRWGWRKWRRMTLLSWRCP